MFLESLFSTEYSSDPLHNFWYGPVGRRTKAGVDVNESTAFTYSVVWAATRLLTGTIGVLPLNVYRRLENDGREIAVEHAAQNLLHVRPNPEMTAFSFRSLMANWQVNWGNAFAEIQWRDRQRRIPFALWPIHPSRVRKVEIEGSDDEWRYEVKNKTGVEPTYFRPEDMLHVPNIITTDGIWGLGVIAQARETIGSGLGAEREASLAFGEGRMPRIVVETPQDMQDKARAAFRKEWRELHSDGAENVALLTRGAQAKPLLFNARDQQFLESRQFTVEEMARWYGIPPHMLQHLLGIKYNSAEQLGQEFVTYSLLLYLLPWEQECGHKLLAEPERMTHFIKFVVLGLLRGDSTARQAYYHAMRTDGVFTANDVLRLEDMNPKPGGDRLFIQGAMVPLDDDGLPIPQETSSDLQQPSNGRESSMKAAARTVLLDALNRVVSRESLAAKRAAKQPTKFNVWLDEFYPEHTTTITEWLAAPLEVCAVFGVKNEPAVLAQRLCSESRARLLLLTGEVTADKLPEAVDALMADWLRDRAAAIVRGIAELN